MTVPQALHDYKVDTGVLVGGRYDSSKVRLHWTGAIRADGRICNSLFYQLQQKNVFVGIKMKLSFPNRYTTTRLGTCFSDRSTIYLYCRSLKVFLHEICHFVFSGHKSDFSQLNHRILDLVDTIIPINTQDKITAATTLIKYEARGQHYDEDGTILHLIELSASINDLNPDDLLDAYYDHR